MSSTENHVLLNPQEKASRELDTQMRAAGSTRVDDVPVTILDEKLKARETEVAQVEEPTEQEEEQEEVSKAVRSAPVLTQRSERSTARVLILTKNAELLGEGSPSRRHILELSEVFSEVHVVILRHKKHSFESKKRIAENVWLYPTNSSYWWKTILDARSIVKKELMFMQGFRADLIIAEDPFESAVVAYLFAKKFKRAFQVHIFEDIFDPKFVDAEPHNNYRIWISNFVMDKVTCVRTHSERLRKKIADHYPQLKDQTELLPVYYNLSAWRTAAPATDLKERFPQFKLIMLCVSKMSELSHTDRIITGATRALSRYPSVGLVIVGDGPLREKLEEQVATFGLSQKVFFEGNVHDVVSYMKAADLLLYLSEDQEEEVVVVQAAAAGLPMILGSGGLASVLYKDGESALMCPHDSPQCVAQKIDRFLSDNSLRTSLAEHAEMTAFGRIEQDYGVYLETFKKSIERCLAAES